MAVHATITLCSFPWHYVYGDNNTIITRRIRHQLHLSLRTRRILTSSGYPIASGGGFPGDKTTRKNSALSPMSQLTHVTRTVFTDDARSTIPDSPGVNAAAQQWAEHRQRSLERLELDVKVASDGIERDWMAEPILKMMGPLLHFLCDMRELLEVRLGEQDGKVVNVHDVASQTLLETNTLKVGLQALDSKVGALESKVVALDLKVDNVRGVTSQALFGMNASEVGLRALDSKVDNVHGVVSQALFESNTLKVGLQALDSKVGALESKVDTLGSKVDKLESKVDANHEETMNALGRVLASIKELKG